MVDLSDRKNRRTRGDRRGFSIMEVMVVLTITAVMIRMALPSFYRSVEKTKADIAIANLRALWAAEQFYWVENRNFSSDFDALNNYNLLPPDVLPAAQTATPAPPYSYTIVSYSATGFTIKAQRANTSALADAFQIDQTGAVTGNVTLDDGYVILPPTAY